MRERVSADELRSYVRENRSRRRFDQNEAGSLILRAASEIEMLHDALENRAPVERPDDTADADHAALVLLRQARDTADATMAAANERALDVERTAGAMAQKTLTDAEHQAKALLDEVEREADTARQEAQRQVVTLITEAEQHAARIVEEATLRSNALNAEAERNRAEAEAECTRLREQTSAEIADLSRRVEALDRRYRANVDAIRAQARTLLSLADEIEATATVDVRVAEVTDLAAHDDDTHDDDHAPVLSFLEAHG